MQHINNIPPNNTKNVSRRSSCSEAGFSDGSAKGKTLCIQQSGNNSGEEGVPRRRKSDRNNHELFASLLPPSQPIVSSHYTLEADMLFGWKPKLTRSGPIPLSYEDTLVNSVIASLREKHQPSTITTVTTKLPRLMYIGYRPANSFRLHEAFSDTAVANAYNYKSNRALGQAKINEILSVIERKNNSGKMLMPFQGMNPRVISEGQSPHLVHFDAKFESGNLDCAVQVGPFEYDLYIRVDSNTKGHLTWYYFAAKVAAVNTRIKFNICNCRRSKSLYMRGMKPYVFSELRDTDWTQQGENVSYKLKAFKNEVNQDMKTYFCLSFEYEFSGGEQDLVRFAYCPPYTFTDLRHFMKKLIADEKSSGIQYIKEEKFCSSMSGLDVPMLTITDYSAIEEEIKQRKVVIAQARIHPGESNSSQVMCGFLEFLCSQDKTAIDLRSKCVFKVIPMMNPDGVIAGNFRTGFAGRDLNRMFKSQDKMLFPSVIALKDLVRDTKRVHGNNLLMFLDLHGHSVKKNVFTYGPDYPIFDVNYFKCRLFSKILAKNSNMFRYFSCIFRISQMKKYTARGILFRNFDVPNCFTVEASNGSYYLGNQQTKAFSIADWKKMGVQMAQAISEYMHVIDDFEVQRKRRMIQLEIGEMNRKPISQSSYECLTRRMRMEDGNDSASKEQQPKQISTTGPTERKKKSSNRVKTSTNRKLFSVEKHFLVDETPLASYFSPELEEAEKKLQEESDGFSEDGMDSDSDGDDFDKGFLKTFEIAVQQTLEQFDKLCTHNNTTTSQSSKTTNKEPRSKSLKESSRFSRRETSFGAVSKQIAKTSQLDTLDRLEMKRKLQSATTANSSASTTQDSQNLRSSSFHTKLTVAAQLASSVVGAAGSAASAGKYSYRKAPSIIGNRAKKSDSLHSQQLSQSTVDPTTIENFKVLSSLKDNRFAQQSQSTLVDDLGDSLCQQLSLESPISRNDPPESQQFLKEFQLNQEKFDKLLTISSGGASGYTSHLLSQIPQPTAASTQQPTAKVVDASKSKHIIKPKQPTAITLVSQFSLHSANAFMSSPQQYPMHFPSKLLRHRQQRQQLQQQQEQSDQYLSSQIDTIMVTNTDMPNPPQAAHRSLHSSSFRREKVITPMELLQLTYVMHPSVGTSSSSETIDHSSSQQLQQPQQQNLSQQASHLQSRRLTNSTFAHQFKMQKAQFHQSDIVRSYQQQANRPYSTMNKEHFFQSYGSNSSSQSQLLFNKEGVFGPMGGFNKQSKPVELALDIKHIEATTINNGKPATAILSPKYNHNPNNKNSLGQNASMMVDSYSTPHKKKNISKEVVTFDPLDFSSNNTHARNLHPSTQSESRAKSALYRVKQAGKPNVHISSSATK